MSKFKKLQHKLQSEGYSKQSATKIAASIGDKKYGKEGMAEKAAEARKSNDNA
jgi:hypothetical protein